MRRELDGRLCREFPNLYKDRRGDKRSTAMCWGFSCDDGWFDILYELSAKLEALIVALPEAAREHCCASQVKEKYGCYDEQTEILTNQGWKLFKDLSETDLVATLSKGQYLTYTKPTDIISYPYEGEMYQLCTRGVDLLVTPNHNLYVAPPPKINGRHRTTQIFQPFELTTYEKFFGSNKTFKKDAVWIGEESQYFELPGLSWEASYRNRHKEGARRYKKPTLSIKMDAWLNFLGWYAAEGCCDERGNITISYDGEDEEQLFVVQAIKSIGFSPKIYGERGHNINFNSKQIALWLRKHCGSIAHKKRVPRFIQELSPRQIKIFIEALYKGDGHKAKSSHALATTSQQLADQVQELLLKIGEVGHISVRQAGQWSKDQSGINRYGKAYFIPKTKRNSYYVNRLKKGLHQTQAKGLAESSKEQIVRYEGMVHCVTVPEHVIYVRRNGKPVWCGNSLRFYMTLSTEEMEQAINEAEEKTCVTCEKCGQPGRKRDSGWIKVLCDKCDHDRQQRQEHADINLRLKDKNDI